MTNAKLESFENFGECCMYVSVNNVYETKNSKIIIEIGGQTSGMESKVTPLDTNRTRICKIEFNSI